MEEIISQFEEISETSEARNIEHQSLDDATLEPGAYIEQNNDIQQAEAIQKDMVEISENIASTGTNEGATPLPIPRPEDSLLEEEMPGSLDKSLVETANQVENLRTLSRTLADILTRGESSDPESIQLAARQMNELAGKFEDLLSSPSLEPEKIEDITSLSQEVMYKIQQAMDDKDQAEKTLSSILSAFTNTQRDLVSNLK